MGHVKSTPQNDFQGQPTGIVNLEITYGGHEAPFGGIDSSAPPAYIDPHCFDNADGFLVVDNQVVAMAFNPITTSFPGVPSAAILLGAGEIYNSTRGTFNYVLFYTAASFGTLGVTASGVTYTFYLASSSAMAPLGGTVDTLSVTLYDAQRIVNPASLSLTCIATGYVIPATASVVLKVSGPLGGPNTYTIALTSVGVYTQQGIVASMVTAMASDPNVSAAASPDGYSLVLTAKANGVPGSSFTIQDFSVMTGGVSGPPFYFSCVAPTHLIGTVGATFATAPTSFNPPTSFTPVGGTLFMANLGPMILRWDGPGKFAVSTMYNGMRIIKKFAGSLIGLGLIPQLGTVSQNQDMIFAWSSALNLDEWAPVTTAGNVTGAGFAQLADIGDYLSGLIVTNNTAFIIRSQGISYATALGSGSDPFQFAHIGLGDQGEGGQIPSLIAQYDQTGVYVGNSDIFQISGNISSIGTKIRANFFTNLATTLDMEYTAVAGSVYLGGDSFPIVGLGIDGTIYFFDAEDKTWMTSTLALTTGVGITNSTVLCNFFGSSHTAGQDLYSQNILCLGVQTYHALGTTTTAFYSLTEGVINPPAGSLSNPQYLTFPQEELLFGRDVTVDGIYFAAYINFTGSVGVVATLSIAFLINGVLFSTLVIQPNMYTLGDTPFEFKIFPQTGNGFTSHSPQLSIQAQVTPYLGGAVTSSILRIVKTQIYASFDANQRPV